mmetsp:Transcript_110604/g.307511  ORF Transcript_110604/g.307511 Transcript_110604/m.307511 type:complete len:95 (-) Transcript_110604:287-571(-)
MPTRIRNRSVVCLEVGEFIGRFPASALRRAADELAELPEEDEEEAEDDGVAEMFRALDTDSDGKIARDEMLATVLQEAPADWRRSSTSPTRTGT